MRQPQYRISVTTLEKFRRYLAETSSYDTEEALIESLSGKFEGNDKTKVGSAFHKIIEQPGSVIPKLYNTKAYMVSEGIAFPVNCSDVALVYKNQHPHMVCEMPISKVYHGKIHSVLVSGRVDGIEGAQIRDAKTKFRAPSDIADYTDSCQWKFYEDMLGMKVFHFDVFEVKRFKELKEHTDGICYLEGIDIVHHEPITCLSYMSMRDELLYLIDRFMEYIELRNFFHLLKPADAKTQPIPAG